MKNYIKKTLKIKMILFVFLVCILPKYSMAGSNDSLQSDEAKDEIAEPILLGDADRGKDLFSGDMRLENRGPTCMSCHNLDINEIITGGVLAKDLTNAYSRLGGAGISSMMGNPPFPAMRTAYDQQPLTEQEIKDIEAFLKNVDNRSFVGSYIDYGDVLLYSGFGMMLTLLFIASLVWRSRKTETVKKSIINRQLKSN